LTQFINRKSKIKNSLNSARERSHALLLATFQIAPVWLICPTLLAFVTSTHIGTEVW
jgi:hypothetical protein